MSYKRCCVPGCISQGTVLHEFPNPAKDIDRFMKWLFSISGDILKLSNEYIYKNRRVCRMHFDSRYHCRSNRLSNIAVPTINMPCLTNNLLEDLQSSTSMSLSSSNAAGQGPFRQIQNLPKHAPSPFSLTKDNNVLITSASEPSMHTDLISQEKENIAPVSKLILVHKSAPDPKENIYNTKQRAAKKMTKVRMSRMRMTRPEQDLYKKLVSVKRKLCKYKNKLTKQAAQLKQAKKISTNPAFIEAMENMPASAKILTLLQFREQKKEAKGRRFHLKEKITALSILKQSPKAYRFLRKIFVLPAPQTLQKLLTKANIKPGINKNIFDQLKSKSAGMKMNEKLCILLYDEMSLKTNVTYNERKDNITGFVTNGRDTKQIFANHAQVFMIRGVQKNYKQPVSYSFSSGATKGPELAQQIKEVICNLQEAGLKVVATVCDQGTNNRTAITHLLNQTRGEFLKRGQTPKDNIFIVNGEEIVPLYDPPHLLKGIRNNLLTKKLQFESNGEIKVAKWQHLELFHNENPSYKGVKIVPKLTDNHVVPQKIAKMKVKYASQVFSRAVASSIGYLADKKILPEECKHTADLLLFFDKIFDSVNGSYAKKKRFAKPLLGPATPTSVHHEAWREGIRMLKTMKFIHTSGKIEVVPTLNNWVWTLEGMEVLLKNLEKEFNITSVWMRHLNQDPIENFFGAIRSHGCRNTNPTPERFESAFTTLLINSLTSVHAPGGNCENDLGEALITLIDEDCKANDDDATCETTIEDILMIELEPIENKKQDLKILATLQYISGYFINKTKKIYRSCDTCKKELMASQEAEYIRCREYADRRWLCSPSDSILTIISHMQDVAIAILKEKLEQKNLKLYIQTVVYILVDFKSISCKSHKEKLTKYLVNAVSRFFIYNYCKNINKIICGRKEIDDLHDKIQVMAKNIFEKSLKIKKRTFQ